MSAESYPPHNPFPRQATTSLEGTGVDLPSNAQPDRKPTLLWPPIRELLALTSHYLEHYVPRQSDAGQFIAIRGAHGAGKTHALRYVIQSVARREIGIPESVERLFQVYVKAEGPDFLAIYRALMAQVPLTVLRELNRRFIGVVASEQIEAPAPGGTERDPDVVKESDPDIVKLLRDPDRLRNPDTVRVLFDQYLLEEGAVREQQERKIGRMTGNVRHFQRVLSYLNSDDLSQAAHNWLKGLNVTSEEMSQLGVTGPIASTTVAKWALQLVATLFARVGHPFMLYLDQYEKLVLNEDNRLTSQNAGLLHSLIEVVPRENGMLVLCGNEEAWDILPPDFQQRFARHIIEFPPLEFEQALEVAALYIGVTRGKPAFAVSHYGGSEPRILREAELHPFTSEGVQEILRSSGGNMRRFIQTCSDVFDAGPKRQKFGREITEAALAKGGRGSFPRETVLVEIEALLKEHLLSCTRNFQIANVKADLAVHDAAGAPRLLVQIQEAVFHEDEARHALENLQIAEKAISKGIIAPIVLVVLGYFSPAVLKESRQFANQVLIYRPDTFTKRFRPLVERLRVPAATPLRPAAPLERDVLKSELAEVRANLENLVNARIKENATLESRLTELFERQHAGRLTERRQEARQAWAEERRRIEESVEWVRAERKKRNFDEFQRLRERAESSQVQRLLIQAGLVAAGGIVSGAIITEMAAYYVRHANVSPDLEFFYPLSQTGWAWGLLFALVAATPFVLRALNWVGSAWLRELRSPVNSESDLQHLAGEVRREVPKQRRLLRSRDPQFRYVGAHLTSDVNELLPALETERSPLVRQAIVKSLVENADIGDSPATWERIARYAGPEAVYAVERVARQGRWDALRLIGTTPALMTLAVLAGAPPRRSKSLALLMAAILQGAELPEVDSEFAAALREAYERGPDQITASSAFHRVPDGRVREAVRELSPFHDDGLSVYDDFAHKRCDYGPISLFPPLAVLDGAWAPR